MKRFIFILLICLNVFSLSQAATVDCLILKRGEKILIQEGKDCHTPFSPNSSFKIPLALMGFESKILKGLHTPVWKPQKPVNFLQYYHDGEQSPSSWMRFSVVWYSQALTQKLGIKKFQEYIQKLDYGNKDLSGDTGKKNGLTDSWLTSSLKITPLQQIEFIGKLAKNELPFSKESQIKTKHLIKLMEESLLIGGWSMHGKTGSADFGKSKRREGYFVGFAEKNGEIISFVIHLSGDLGDQKAGVGGIQAKKILFDKMLKENLLL